MSINLNTEAQKDQAQLEREINEQRAHLGDTISALEAQFSPGQMLDKMLSYTKTNGADFTNNLVQTVKNNPVPTLLTALGVAWLMYGQNHSGTSGYGSAANASYGVDPVYEPHSSKMGEFKEKAHQLSDKAHHLSASVKGGIAGARHSASHAGMEVRQRASNAAAGFERLLHEQPLAVGALGLAVGALLAASMPATRTEDRYLGKTRDKVADKAREKVQEGKQQVNALGEKLKSSEQRPAEGTGPSFSDQYRPVGTQTTSDGSPKLHS